jgi:hypothetical protein
MEFLQTNSIESIIKNRNLLSKFTFEEVTVGSEKLVWLKITKISDPEQHIYLPFKGKNPRFNCLPLWNIFEQEFFPASVTILNKVIKISIEDICYSRYNRPWSQIDEDDKTYEALPFNETVLQLIIFRHFSYKGLKFNVSDLDTALLNKSQVDRRRLSRITYTLDYLTTKGVNLLYKEKPHLQVSKTQSFIYQKFIEYVYQGKYYKPLYDAVLLLFRLANSNYELNHYVQNLVVDEENRDLKITLFNSSSSPVFTQGQVEAAMIKGDSISKSTFSWIEASKSRNPNIQRLARNSSKPVQVSSEVKQEAENKCTALLDLSSKNNSHKKLSFNASENYNKEVYPVYYWDLL